MHDPTEGGINGALYEMQDGSGLGIELFRENIPVSPLTLRAAEKLHFDPHNLISSGMLTAVIPPERVKNAQAELESAGVISGIAGRFYDGGKLSFSTHEELWKILGM